MMRAVLMHDVVGDADALGRLWRLAGREMLLLCAAMCIASCQLSRSSAPRRLRSRDAPGMLCRFASP